MWLELVTEGENDMRSAAGERLGSQIRPTHLNNIIDFGLCPGTNGGESAKSIKHEKLNNQNSVIKKIK